jgi:hypothetical protein
LHQPLSLGLLSRIASPAGHEGLRPNPLRYVFQGNRIAGFWTVSMPGSMAQESSFVLGRDLLQGYFLVVEPSAEFTDEDVFFQNEICEKP